MIRIFIGEDTCGNNYLHLSNIEDGEFVGISLTPIEDKTVPACPTYISKNERQLLKLKNFIDNEIRKLKATSCRLAYRPEE